MIAADKRELGIELFTDFDPEVEPTDDANIEWQTPRSPEDLRAMMAEFAQGY